MLRSNLFQYLGTDAVELLPDAKEVGLPVADHDVGDVRLLKAVHHTGGHRALGQMILIHLDIFVIRVRKKLNTVFLKVTK